MILKHRLQADDNRAEIKVVKDYGTIPDLLCFPGQMSQVFMNILANAIDAFDEQRPAQPLVTLRTFVKDDQVQIQISDNAGGMPDAVRANIFDRAYTTKAVGKGTGLGLSIAQQIVVDTHGGRLSCRSTPGDGSTFMLTLPV